MLSCLVARFQVPKCTQSTATRDRGNVVGFAVFWPNELELGFVVRGFLSWRLD
jgi:hypothetical protein